MSVRRTTIILFLIILIFPLTDAHAESKEKIYQSLHNGNLILKLRVFDQEEKPTVYLTFDDGPSDLTSEVIDILKEEGVGATFFVIGKSAINNQDLLKRMVSEGHTIGNHSYTHNYSKIYHSFSAYFDEIIKTEEVIYDITGKRTSLIRAPGGTYMNWDSFYFYYMDQADYLIYDWNVDSGDASRKNVSAQEILDQIKKSKFKEKLIILLHDGKGHKNTVQALPDIIKYYKDKGYQFKPLTEKVEPIMQPLGFNRWQRNDEFNFKENFTRLNNNKDNLPSQNKLVEKEKFLLSSLNDDMIEEVDKKIIKDSYQIQTETFNFTKYSFFKDIRNVWSNIVIIFLTI